MPSLRRPSLVVLALLVGGCGSSTITSTLTSRTTLLDNTISSYDASLRWSRWDAVLSNRHKDAPAMPKLDLDNVEVTGYEKRLKPVQLNDETAMQTVDISYVLRNKQVVKKIKDEQIWRYDEETKQWWLHSNFPELK
jgi:hypothetical protein